MNGQQSTFHRVQQAKCKKYNTSRTVKLHTQTALWALGINSVPLPEQLVFLKAKPSLSLLPIPQSQTNYQMGTVYNFSDINISIDNRLPLGQLYWLFQSLCFLSCGYRRMKNSPKLELQHQKVSGKERRQRETEFIFPKNIFN